ncbi:hypothetical protein [Streptomyces sp. NPDC002666]
MRLRNKTGANRWRNPEDDSPADFEDYRDVHYAALGTWPARPAFKR